jgi:hypothetical protein
MSITSTARSALPMEQDTADTEDIGNIYEFLMKDGALPEHASQVSLSYSRSCLEGWVKQPSPCCGAAAIAGAWNALANLKRNDPRALNHISILNIYRIMFVDMIEKKTKSYERKLGHKIDRIIADIRTRLFGQSPDHNIKGKNVTKKAFNLAMKAVMKSYLDRLASFKEGSKEDNKADGESSPAVEEFEVRDDLQSLIDLYLAEGGELDGGAVADDCPALDLVEEEEKYKEGDDGDESKEADESEDLVNVIPKIGATKPVPSKFKSRFPSKPSLPSETAASATTIGSGLDAMNGDNVQSQPTSGGHDNELVNTPIASAMTNSWDWKGELKGILMNMGGLMRLMDAKPSTTAIGNWGILQCVQKLAQWTGLGSSLEANLFMGKKLNKMQKVAHPLSKNDDSSMIGSQWAALRSAFNRSDTVLLFHLTNHYALIYAMREWNEEVKVPDDRSSSVFGDTVHIVHRRQILTARRGQRPNAWIDFTEVRDILLGWEGFKIMEIKRTAAPFSAPAILKDELIASSTNTLDKEKEKDKEKAVVRHDSVVYFDIKSATIEYPTDSQYAFIFDQ